MKESTTRGVRIWRPEVTIGLDVGDRRCKACEVDAATAPVRERFTVRTTREGLVEAFGGRERVRVVMEVGPHSPWMSRCLEGLGHEVVVANPRKVRLIGGEKKTDRIDAEKLARLGRVDVMLLSPIRHRDAQSQRDLAVLRARDRAVASRTMLINHVRGAVKATGERLPPCSGHAFARQALEHVPPELGPALGPLLRAIRVLTALIDRYDAEVETMSRERYPSTQRLRSVAGVGALTALAFVLVVGGSPRRFGRTRRIGAYLGLCPRVEESGEHSAQLPITKAGDGLLRRLLVQSAHYILGPFGPDCTLRRVGKRLEAGGGRGAKRRAVVCVARRLAILLLRLWKSDDAYDPLRNAPCVMPTA